MARRRTQRGSPISLFSFQDIISCVTGIMILLVLLLILDVITKAEIAAEALQEPEAIPYNPAEVPALKEELEHLKEEIKQNEIVLDHSASLDTANVAEEISDAERRISESERKMRQAREKHRSVKKRLEQIPDIRHHHKKQTDQIRDIKDKIANLRSEQSKHVEQIEGEIANIRGKTETMKSGKKIFYLPAVRESKKAILVQCGDNSIKVQPINHSEKVKAFATAEKFMEYTKTRNKSLEYFVILVKPDGIDAFEQIKTLLNLSDYDIGYEPLEQDKEAVFD